MHLKLVLARKPDRCLDPTPIPRAYLVHKDTEPWTQNQLITTLAWTNGWVNQILHFSWRNGSPKTEELKYIPNLVALKIWCVYLCNPAGSGRSLSEETQRRSSQRCRLVSAPRDGTFAPAAAILITHASLQTNMLLKTHTGLFCWHQQFNSSTLWNTIK